MSGLRGFIWVRQLARGDNDLSWKAIAVARVLGDHADGDGRCSLLRGTIAREARIGERSVYDGLDELVDAKALRATRTRGASLFVLVASDPETGIARRSTPAPHADMPDESGTACRIERQEAPTRSASDADRRVPQEGNTEEVNLSEGADGDRRTKRAEEDHGHSLKAIKGNGTGQRSPAQPPLLPPVKPALAVQQQLAHRLWLILDGGFGGLADPEPTWKRPTEFAVLSVLDRHAPGSIVAERAAQEARRTLQQREDGRNVVGLFEHKLKVELGKQEGIHRRVLKTLAAGGAS